MAKKVWYTYTIALRSVLRNFLRLTNHQYCIEIMKDSSVLRGSLLFLCVLSGLCPAFAQTSIPVGGSIKVDGVIEPKEWNDAASFAFAKSDIVTAKVFAKHDGAHLLLAYIYENPKDSTYILPEFFIDTKFTKGKIWGQDDFWFHVSAQDCFAIGKREDYSLCSRDDAPWKAVPNYPYGNAYKKIDVFEISIPFELVKVVPGQTVGICFSIAIFPGELRLNHPQSSHEDVPETWMAISIE